MMFKKFKVINKVGQFKMGAEYLDGEKGINCRELEKLQTLEDAARLLKYQGAAVAALAVQDLQAYWLSIMQDSNVSTKDRLAASRLYAQSIGAFDAKQQQQQRQPEGYKWADDDVVDAETVSIEPNKDTDNEE